MQIIEKKTLNLNERENGQSKSSALIKNFKAVNQFFLSIEIRLKSSYESGF